MDIDDFILKKLALQKCRDELLGEIARLADEIKKIDSDIAIAQSCQLEDDLHAEVLR